ncbi:diaminopimelate epimerase [Sphingomonas sediminicola]|uniref:Diaminopimelate epimerase n=1 Tax=Sphingomonas sediminicola TaxID=386874 RepID=A0ABX6TCR7_9SPHN|nr:diaminopimelate epimerase [Sphingomonas sediminicola]QNP46782.1 diaminopimelate epimerase [Sphingomonas sediminicola]
MTRTFHKMHGLGNDFVIFDAREEPLAMDEPLARAVSDRKTGIGCDQLVVLEKSTVADLRMRIWNHDGIEVESCGNASRCVVALTHAKTIETGGGLVRGEEDGSDIEVSLGEPHFEWDQVPVTYAIPTNPMPMAWGELHNPVALSVGNPHVVFFVDNADSIDLDELGPRIEHDPVFPDRINVNVAEVHPDGIRLRTWERGAGITRACGTGASATAVAAILTKRVQSPVKVTMRGGSLTIAWAPGEPIRMRGSATYVFKGEIELEALA